MKNVFRAVLYTALFSIAYACSSDSDDSHMPTPTCPTGYYGTGCANELQPLTMRISKVTITNFPAFRSDFSEWDEFAVGEFQNPDIYIELNQGATGVFGSGGNYADATNVVDYDFTFTNYAIISNPTATHSLYLYDQDNGVSEVMASVNFTPYLAGQDFPSVLTVTNAQAQFQAKIHVTYQWQ